MVFVLGLCFRQHTVERWESARPDSGERPVSQRRHALAFTCEELDIDYFSPVGKVNDDHFLSAGPGRLLCENVVVTKLASSISGQPHTALLEVSEEPRLSEALWLLEYQLVETAGRPWNEVPDGEDPASAFPMTAFFGREEIQN
jgi:hypothetical protein